MKPYSGQHDLGTFGYSDDTEKFEELTVFPMNKAFSDLVTCSKD